MDPPGKPADQKVKKSLCSLTEPQQIRLLKVRLRGQGQLELVLETFSFSKAPPYEALSYFWGKGKPKTKFRLNVQCKDCRSSHPLKLLPNLHSALMCIMSHHTPADHERTLWTDRICIDQKDLADKNVQLDQMPEIYTNAQHVLVWLGDPIVSDAVVKATLETGVLFTVADKMSDLATKVGPSFDPQKDPGLPPADDPVWTVFSDMMRKDWYKRVWTLQEAVLAKELIVYYGTSALTWDQVVRLVNVYGQVSLLREREDAEDGHRWRFHHVMWVNQYRKFVQQKPRQTIDFAHLLQTSMYKDSTNDKDRVFAVLGMADPDIRAAIRPDYKKSLRQIFIEAFHHVLPTDPTLQFLGLPFERGGGANSLPTWCPDLTRWNGCEAQMQPPRKRSKPAACPSSIRIGDGDRLHISGFVADTIAAVSHAPFPSHGIRDPDRRWRLIAAYYRESLALAKAAGSSNDADAEAAHWRTLIANRHGDETRYSTEDAERGYRCYFVRGSRAGQSAEQKRLANMYSSYVLAACNRRKFFRSSGGRVGLAPDACQVGDVVCVFQGAAVPHMLRRNIDHDSGASTTFSFLGDCYVHGLMDSAIVDQFDEGVVPGREFVVT